MNEGFFGMATIERTCIDCGITYYTNAYDPGAVRCPECRQKRYREADAKIMADLARRNRT